jgi:hypothetical protein
MAPSDGIKGCAMLAPFRGKHADRVAVRHSPSRHASWNLSTKNQSRAAYMLAPQSRCKHGTTNSHALSSASTSQKPLSVTGIEIAANLTSR